MRRKADSLKLGKGQVFDKARLKRLRQEEDSWEADFRALPKPMMQNETHYLGLVISKRCGSVPSTASTRPASSRRLHSTASTKTAGWPPSSA